MARYYNTALAGGLRLENITPEDRVESNGSTVIRNDIVVSGLPAEFSECDVIFSDCPWPHGIKKFDARAGISGRSYSDFALALNGILGSLQIPVYLTLGKQLLGKLPKPVGVAATNLNKSVVGLAWWNVEHHGPTVNVEDLHKYLGRTYEVAGDFCCGYGESMFNFMAAGGKRFVASDYDGNCVAVVGQRLKGIL